ncbi:kinesin-like protein KIF20B [Battus philenor]|uniref:kinesin-like protein KIF20B n=1 Tax=Battus philenor TaxID=42288 RepID=UPI0035D0AEC6
MEQRSSNESSRRDIPSFIEPRPPLISNPFMRPRPQKGTNLLEQFEQDSECEEPELVQVYLRLKPCNIPSNLYEVKSDRCLITSLDTATIGHGRRTQHNVSKMYTFSHIFGPEADQKELFERIVKDNLKKLPDGHSFTLLTYGASGSGKTFTLMGTVASPGLVPRSLEYVFRVVDAAQNPVYKPADNGAEKLSYSAQEHELQFIKQIRQMSAPLRDKYRRMSVRLRSDLAASNLDLTNRTKYYVWVSFVEIYNEGIYDLLSTSDRSAASKLVIREDYSGNVYVKGATQVFVRTGEEAYDVMVAGKRNLQVAATGVNLHSSRSHCIFTITMLTENDGGCRVSSVRLCDLAGCERARRTRNAGARLAESRAINSSLHVLERCLRTLRRRQRVARDALVPYRESKLTRLLGAGLSGARGEAVSVVVTLNPAPDCADETKHVLQLAAVARDIQVNNTVSEYSSLETSSQDTIVSSSSEVLKLRVENERLHFELLQSQACYKELLASMEMKQAETANTMKELVDEAKDMTRQYYEALMQSLRGEMEEMKEEYEARLSQLDAQAQPRGGGTPMRNLQQKISQLITERAILEEKLSAEILARVRAKEELQHLRVCIEERDEKSYEEALKLKEDGASAIDSDGDSDGDNDGDNEDDNDDDSVDDPCNESLEPTFTMEELNRSRITRQSVPRVSAEKNNLTADSNDTLKDESDESVDRSVINVSGREECTYFVRVSQDSASDEVQDEDITIDDVIKEESIHEVKTDEEPPAVMSDSLVNKFLKSVKSDPEEHNSNSSLMQFEELEKAANTVPSPKKLYNTLTDFKLKENKRYFDDDLDVNKPDEVKKIYFDNLDVKVETKESLGLIENKNIKSLMKDDVRSPSIVKDENVEEYVPSTMKKLFESFTRPDPVSIQKNKLSKINNNSLDMFIDEDKENVDLVVKEQLNTKNKDIETLEKSFDNIILSNKNINNTTDKPQLIEEPFKMPEVVLKFEKSNATETSIKVDDTLEAFEAIYKDISQPSTEFEMLLTQDTSTSNNETSKRETSETRYKLRKNKTDKRTELKTKDGEEILLETQAKCESVSTVKRSLRLRRHRNNPEGDEQEIRLKQKDIVNLQQEFSDVTLDLPAPRKEVTDISSPDKEEQENLPPNYEIQSCPAKSVTRSRRKLYTPRAEPLEESSPQTGDSTERVRVPRPSYHRPRARRKL